MQGKGSNPLKVLIKETKVIYQSIDQLNSGWCHNVIKFQLYIYIYIYIYMQSDESLICAGHFSVRYN